MQTTLRYEQQDGHAEAAPQGRFGRAPEIDDAHVADTRTTTHPDDDGQDRFDQVRYEVDPDAVARAIVERLVAGRTWPALRCDRS